ncbi:MAG: DUF1573 domain-containing protein [Pirellula sp.]|jgi:hypothetical protein|nr:DUF1573 domain-containing protein [Pirellula sp.]
MKSLVFAILVALLAGYGLASYLEVNRNHGLTHVLGKVEDMDAALANFKVATPGETAKAGKIEVVGGEEYNFGTMKRGGKRSHAFVFKNVGDAPADVWFIRSSCKCTVGRFQRATLNPGEETNVELEWVLEGSTPDFAQTATIGTTAPQQEEIALTIRGKIGQSHVFDPPGILVADLISNEDSVFEGKVYCLEQAPMAFDDASVADLTVTKKIFCNIVQIRPLTEDELVLYPDAKTVMEYKVTVAKGIGATSLNTNVVFRNSQNSEEEPALLPVSGRIVTPVRIIAGSDYTEDKKILRLGIAPSSEGLKKSLLMAVSTKEYPEAAISFKEIQPQEFAGKINVTVGNPTIRGSSKIYPVTIEIPPGTEPVERNGSSGKDFARVVFDTQMENSPTEMVFIQFRITE